MDGGTRWRLQSYFFSTVFLVCESKKSPSSWLTVPVTVFIVLCPVYSGSIPALNVFFSFVVIQDGRFELLLFSFLFCCACARSHSFFLTFCYLFLFRELKALPVSLICVSLGVYVWISAQDTSQQHLRKTLRKTAGCEQIQTVRCENKTILGFNYCNNLTWRGWCLVFVLCLWLWVTDL